MDFGTGVREVVGIHFSQQHRAFESLGLGELRRFGFGELEEGPTDAAALRVTVAPPPVLDELSRPLHGFVFDQAGLDLRHRGTECATFPRNWRSRFRERTQRKPAIQAKAVLGIGRQRAMPLDATLAKQAERWPDS